MSVRLAHVPQARLFSWEDVETCSDLERLSLALDDLLDDALMQALEAHRAKGIDRSRFSARNRPFRYFFSYESSFLRGNGDDDLGNGRIFRCETRRQAFERVTDQVGDTFCRQTTASIHDACPDWAETQAVYRFFDQASDNKRSLGWQDILDTQRHQGFLLGWDQHGRYRDMAIQGLAIFCLDCIPQRQEIFSEEKKSVPSRAIKKVVLIELKPSQ